MRDRMLTLAFLALIGISLPLDWVLTNQGIEMPGRKLSRETGEIEVPADLFDGSAGTKAEGQLLNGSHSARWLAARYNELSFRLLNRMPSAGRLGRDGWIFVTSRVVDHRTSHWASLKETFVRDIGRVDAFLSDRGAQLVVGLIPDRARIYPDRAYPSGQLPEGKAAYLPAVAEALEREGVEVIVLTSALSEQRAAGHEPFYSDDHHWTSWGAERSAIELAEAVRSHLVRNRARVSQSSDLRWDLEAQSPGSLIRKLGFRPGSRLEAAFRDHKPRLIFEPPPNAPALRWSGSCATYWTTSYGEWGSPQVFSNVLKCPVRIRQMVGGGSDPVPAGEIQQIGLEGPDLGGHVFVWEIPEYHLVVPPGQPSGFARISEALDDLGR